MAIALGTGLMLAFGGLATVDAQAATPTTLPAGSSAWTIQQTPNPTGGSYLTAVTCPSPTVCEAVGHYFNSKGGELTLAEKWNGTEWTVQNTPNPSGLAYLSAVACTSTSACTAVGYSAGDTLAEAWNGTAWAVQKTPNPKGNNGSTLSAVACPSTGACTAVGDYINSSDIEVTLAEAWSGGVWTIQKTPNPEGATEVGSIGDLSAVACPSTGDCTAVGYDHNGSGLEGTLAEAWNGIAWTVQKTPSTKRGNGSYLSGVACPSTSDCTAVGYRYSSGLDATLAEAWNGIAWTIQKTPNPKETVIGPYLSGVACPSTSDCTAVGYSAGDTLAEAWNGIAWTIEKTPKPKGANNSYLYGVACPSTSACTAVGYYNNTPDTEWSTLAEGWSALG